VILIRTEEIFQPAVTAGDIKAERNRRLAVFLQNKLKHLIMKILVDQRYHYHNIMCSSACLEARFHHQRKLAFNSPQGACPECRGFGNILKADPDLLVPDPEKSLSGGAIEPLTKPSLKSRERKMLDFAISHGIDTDKPYNKLIKKEKDLIFNGGDGFGGIYGVFKYMERKSYKMHVRVFLIYRKPLSETTKALSKESAFCMYRGLGPWVRDLFDRS